LFAAPSSQSGSVGVWTAHADVSKLLERMGINISLISAGEYKTEGHPFAPLGDEARTEMQSRVDFYHSLFLDAVSTGRGVSVQFAQERFGKGRLMRAEAALEAKMIDGIATMSEVIAGLTPARPQRRGSRRATAEAMIALAEVNSVE
jgi:ClpP class serine protease